MMRNRGYIFIFIIFNIITIFTTLDIFGQSKIYERVINSNNYFFFFFYNSKIDANNSSDYLDNPKFSPIKKLEIKNNGASINNVRLVFNNEKEWYTLNDIYNSLYDNNFKRFYFNVWKLMANNVRHYYSTYDDNLYEQYDIVKLLTIYGYGICGDHAISSLNLFNFILT